MKFFDSFFDGELDNYSISGLSMELNCLYIYNKFIKNDCGFLIITSSIYEGNLIFQTLLNYTDKVLLFPMDDFLTSEAIAISPEFMAERITTLNTLVNDSKYIVVCNLMGGLRYLPSSDVWKSSFIKIKKNETLDRDDFINKLSKIGYERDVVVSSTGKFGVRGYVIDLFPISSDNPIRIELWGDTIDSIKFFDVETQLSISEIDEFIIFPFTEFIIDSDVDCTYQRQKYLPHFSSSVNSIINYIDNCYVFYYDYKMILKSYSLLVDKILEYDSENKSELDTKYMFSLDDIRCNKEIRIYHFDDDICDDNIVKYSYNSVSDYNGNYEDIKIDLLNYLKNGKTVVVCIDNESSVKRIANYLELDDIILTDENNIIENKINFIYKVINSGFIYNDYVVIGSNNLFSLKNSNNYKYKSKYRVGTKRRIINDFEIGDYVVHETFGIGIYKGIFDVTKMGMHKDYIKLLYDNDDILYVPVENINRISKFSGKDGLGVKLSSLSNDKWTKKKTKVREKIKNLAKDLLLVSAKREITPGYAFLVDDENQQVFDSEFKYTETADQIKAIDLIKKEMEKPKPMDVLLCGDVGYGKTEVAFRAIFKAVNNGKQVAYLCPTTILSSQQYNSALDRFKTFPFEIALINRFVDRAKQKDILEKLKDGKIDILFGTHRLLSDDVIFKDLGLLVIDEEQRFGVTHKEKIKKMKSNIDILTLSATPIPRTLQMSMTGVRSLALIETPPKERYPIQTYVLEESDIVIKDAIYKEISRGGQIFILYNRVENIEQKVFELHSLVPEIKFDFVHGQMSKDKLEDKINNFINNKFDVLVCTTIIETGIDMPNVNTLIIIDADKFGLSQLYQIRGRIGRSNKIGYAYLMYDKNKFLSDIAIKRLDTIKEFTELGSGFKIAMRDLSIRGAGDFLGSEQSGFIDTVGIDLYLKMLNEEILKFKGEKVIEESSDTSMGDKSLINVSTHIKDDYVMDAELKIEIHKMINSVSSYNSFLNVKNELEDRFGMVDEDLLTYMYEEWFEKLALKLNIKKVIDGKNSVDIELNSDTSKKVDGEKLFNESYKICRQYRFLYKDDCIHIILDKVNLDKHYVIYLVAILIKVIDLIEDK